LPGRRPSALPKRVGDKSIGSASFGSPPVLRVYNDVEDTIFKKFLGVRPAVGTAEAAVWPQVLVHACDLAQVVGVV
jgi:hypothetical protein